MYIYSISVHFLVWIESPLSIVWLNYLYMYYYVNIYHFINQLDQSSDLDFVSCTFTLYPCIFLLKSSLLLSIVWLNYMYMYYICIMSISITLPTNWISLLIWTLSHVHVLDILLFCNKGTVIISQLWRIRLTFIIIIINISGILWEILQKSMVWFLRKNTKYLFPPIYSL